MEHTSDQPVTVPYTTKDMSPHKKGALDASSQAQHESTSGNEALEILKKERVELERAITLGMTWLAHEMNTAGLLPDDVHNDVTDPRSMLSETQKATSMISALEKRVGINPQNLDKFVEILLKNQPLYGDIVTCLSSHGHSVTRETSSGQESSLPSLAIHTSRSNTREISTENLEKLNAKFTCLVNKLVKMIQQEKIGFKEFRFSAQSLFKNTEIKSENIWDYFNEVNLELFHYGKLEDLANILLGNSPQVGTLFNQYREDIDHYHNLTKIIDFLQSNDKEHLLVQSDAEHTEELRIKITGVEITDKFMSYIEDVWKSLKRIPNLVMATSLLKSIQDSCIEVTWLISKEAAAAMCESDPLSREIFMENHISLVWVNEECIYDEEVHVHSNMSKAYLRLFEACKTGKLNEVKSLSKVPDIDLNKMQDEADVLSLSKPHTEVHSWLKDRLEEELINAAKSNNLVRVKESLQIRDVDPNAREKDKHGWPALLWACVNGHSEVVDTLLEHGADVDVEDFSKWTGLLLASFNGYLTIVMKLLDKGADVNKLTNDSWSSLIWTAQEGHTEVARLLIKRGANITQEDELGFSALLLASQEGHLDIVKLLVEDEETELDIDQKTKSGWTAAMLATRNKRIEVLQYLVEHKSNVHYHNVEEARGINVLHIASYLGFNKIVRYLCLQLKMDVNVQDEDGITPLMFAAKQGRYEVVETLVQNGRADVNIVENHYKWTALFFAAEAGHQKVVECLMRTEKINLNHRDMEDKTIVDLADVINPKAMDYLLTHHKAATEAIRAANKRNPVYKSFNKEDYKLLLDKEMEMIERKAPRPQLCY